MNRSQAGDLISQTFTRAFDRDRFRNFALNLLNHVDETKAFARNSQYIKDAFKKDVSRFERLGTYTSPDKQKLDLLIVHLTKESKLERARTAIRNFVADHLKERDDKDSALVAFVSPSESTWRFSYVKMEYAAVEKDSGKVSVETVLTPARRFSYIVGEGESCHTAQARFVQLLQETGIDPTLARIEEAFSVEAVTKEFFTKYAELFEEIHGALDRLVAKDKSIREDFRNNVVNTVDFAKKLMGQIVFLYFLQKKGWLGVTKGAEWGSGPHDFLRRLWNGEYGRYDNFFNDVLEPLFFDTLATDRGHDAWSETFKCRIPFLNGGLFEPTGGYNWRKTKILLPDRLFANSERVEGDISGTGVLDMFDRYNFTVNEAEPLEKEVAIDPEMLGKVFENLIEENRRKGLGAYYTPREIVHFMCQESIINYLDNSVNKVEATVSRADIEILIHLGEQFSFYEAAKKTGTIGKNYPSPPKSVAQHARLIDEMLSKITICDPAVGSGAFPVGMMTEIVRARASLTPYFNDVQERTPYYFKRHAIQNCLYGVDIDPGAVEIAKLRLWLSLVVDEEDVKRIKPLPNLDYKIMQGNSLIEEYEGIRLFDENLISLSSLDAQVGAKDRISQLQKEVLQLHSTGRLTPGRQKEVEDETKRLTATLKKNYSPVKGSGPMLFAEMEQAGKKAEELRLLHARFFEESRHDQKEKLKKQIGLLEWDLIETTLREEGKGAALKTLEQFKKTNLKPFFLWKLNFSEVFRENGGFDVVVANPPYVGEKGHKEMFRELRRGVVGKYYQKKMDIFYFFFHRALDIGNSSCRLGFITTNYYPTATGAKTLRMDINQRASVLRLVNFNELKIFESAHGQHNMITLLAAGRDDQVQAKTCSTRKTGFADFRQLQDILGWQDVQTDYFNVKQADLYEGVDLQMRLRGCSTINGDPIQMLLARMMAQGELLGAVCSVNQGLRTGADKVSNKHIEGYKLDAQRFAKGEGIFILHRKEVARLKLTAFERKRILPLFKNSDIRKYACEQSTPYSFIDLSWPGDRGLDLSSVPNLIRHLSKYEVILKNRKENANGLDKAIAKGIWWPMSVRRKLDFSQEKIVAPQRSRSNVFGYNDIPWYASADVYFITRNDPAFNLKYVLALLNSRLYFAWLYHKGKRKGEMLELYQKPLTEIPVKRISNNEQKPFVDIIDRILVAKLRDPEVDTADFERDIDQLVYKLYDLTPEEVVVIEESSATPVPTARSRR